MVWEPIRDRSPEISRDQHRPSAVPYKEDLKKPRLYGVNAHRGWDCLGKWPPLYPYLKCKHIRLGSDKIVTSQLVKKEALRPQLRIQKEGGKVVVTPRWCILAITSRIQGRKKEGV